MARPVPQTSTLYCLLTGFGQCLEFGAPHALRPEPYLPRLTPSRSKLQTRYGNLPDKEGPGNGWKGPAVDVNILPTNCRHYFGTAVAWCMVGRKRNCITVQQVASPRPKSTKLNLNGLLKPKIPIPPQLVSDALPTKGECHSHNAQ